MRHVSRLAVALAALTFLGAACSSTTEQVSNKIAKDVQTKLKLSAKPATTCPKGAKAKKGEKFECTVTIEGQDLPVKVVFTKDTFFEATFDGDVRPTSDITKAVATQAKATAVNCGTKTLTVITATKPLTCTYKAADGSPQKLTLKFQGGKLVSQQG